MNTPLTVAWISDFPVEWMPDLPGPLRDSPRRHPATWEMVLLSEFEKRPDLKTHVILLRHRIERGFTFERNGTTFHVLRAPVALRVASMFWLDTSLIRRACRRIQPGLVHAWGMEKGASLIAARLGYPYVATVQGLYQWYRQVIPMGAYDRFIERLERRALPRAPVVTTESAFSLRFLQERYPGLAVVQAEHAPNHAFAAVQRRPQTSPLQFISVGTLGYRKGTDILFKALDKLSGELDFKLSIVSGPAPDYLRALRPQVSERLWQRVQFKEHLLPNEVAKELETPAIFLLPTRADTSPNAVKEAAVAGVPVVASSVGGIPDYIMPGENGLLSAPGDPSGFEQAVRQAVQHPLFSKGLVDEARLARVREYLSPEAMAKSFFKAYQVALEQKRPRAHG